MDKRTTRFAAALLAVFVVASPMTADTGQPPPQTQTRSNTGKRLAWTVVGAAAGFGAGLFLGLNQFDDAIDSDRKVWTSAIVGAAGGAVAAAILSRNVKPSVRRPPTLTANPEAAVDVSWDEAIGRLAAKPRPSERAVQTPPARH